MQPAPPCCDHFHISTSEHTIIIIVLALTRTLTLYQITSRDGGATWSPERSLASFLKTPFRAGPGKINFNDIFIFIF